ncbi:MAG: DUF86 domain-containing protein [Bacteroidia bacterium]|nr:DUF86 domain-containing protein [Bacteroidia bacterium]
MMGKELKYLSDIFQAIELIEDFTARTVVFDDYLKDIKTQSAVERQLAIIGEAVNKFNGLDTNIIIENAEKIVAVRNRLVHAYDAVDNSIIWLIINKYLPQLKSEIKEFL